MLRRRELWCFNENLNYYDLKIGLNVKVKKKTLSFQKIYTYMIKHYIDNNYLMKYLLQVQSECRKSVILLTKGYKAIMFI